MNEIYIENISKLYRLGIISRRTLTHDLQSRMARLLRRDDPNAKIFAPTREIQQAHDGQNIWALRNISLKIEEGEVIGIIGKNGAGKSTLLKILSRVTAPTYGSVHIYGKVASLLEVGTGFHPELTGRENIYLNGSILGMKKNDIQLRFDEIVSFAEIHAFVDTPVKRYSSGMYVRLAFAVAAHLRTEILIVDEVLAVGDAAFQKKCIGKMSEASNSGKTVLFVSHNMASVSSLCHRGVLLDSGSIVLDGAIDDVISNYNSVVVGKYSSIIQFNDSGSKVMMKRACIVDDKKNPCNSVRVNANFGVRVEFESKMVISNPILGIKIKTVNGINVIGINNHFQLNNPIVESCSSGIIEAYFEDNKLNAGDFIISLTLGNSTSTYDIKEDALHLKILEDDYYGTGRLPTLQQSLVLSLCKWRYYEVKEINWNNE